MPQHRRQTLSSRILPAILFLFSVLTSSATSQQARTLSGLVTDPSGAVIPNAAVILHSVPASDQTDQTAPASPAGRYAFTTQPGDYTVTATAPGFAPFASATLHLDSDRPRTLDIHLKIESQLQQIDVSDQPTQTDPENNGDAITLKGKAIDDLPLDSSQMLRQLQALAGSDSPEIYVDGFSGGTLPPRDTIREIRINQNPYSAQNDTNPVNGRIEVFTKPGSEHFHGDLYAYGNDSALNSLNPFVTQEPPYYSANFYATLSGPLTKHSSFFLNGGHRISHAESIVNAQILDSNFNPVNFTQAVSTPSASTSFNVRVDTSLGKKSTLVARYSFDQSHDAGGGIGQFALATQGFDNYNTNQSIQISNSEIFSAKVIDDTRFRYARNRTHQTPSSFAPAIVVQGAFTGGGSNAGAYRDNQDNYEFQNYTSAALGKHFLNFGTRLRDTRDANFSRANYNGEYIFDTLAAYQITQQGLAAGSTSAQIRASGGGASQFNLTAGTPNVAVNVFDAGLFLQDDWKTRPNVTLSYGLRFETQNNISRHADWAPRFGFAYSFGAKPGKTGKKGANPYTLRGGSGIFYRRFTSGYVLQAARQNGITQQEYVVNQPDTYPVIPAPWALGAQAASTIFQISPTIRAPYFLSSTVALERRLGSFGFLAFTFYTNRGVHTQLTRNTNAPLPGTYNPAVPTSGVRPLGGTGNIYQYESSGLYRENRLSANFNAHYKSRLYLYGYYQYRRSDTDDNAGGFPSNQYDIRADYGRAPNLPAHQFNAGIGFDLPFGFNAYNFVRASSGLPFNIVLGQDLNGDSQFNDRPTFASDLTRPSVVVTKYGNFDTAPLTGQTTIPYDYGTGPGLFTLYMQIARDFHFGPEIKPPAGSPAPKLAPGEKPHIERRYTLNFAINADNALNHVNYSTPVGTLNSPLFGHSTALAQGFSSSANRVIGFQTYLHF